MINEALINSLENALETYPHVSVLFHTKTGKERLMHCSRLLSVVPEQDHDGRYDFKINHPSIIGVYDLQNSAWRSFRKDSVISFEASVNEY